eukprot:3776985-Rhodomonas_salina.1
MSARGPPGPDPPPLHQRLRLLQPASVCCYQTTCAMRLTGVRVEGQGVRGGGDVHGGRLPVGPHAALQLSLLCGARVCALRAGERVH